MGRARELDELRGALGRALAGQGELWLLAGEPGIGKSALADRLAEDARAQGARVVHGPCWEGGGAPAYWPWIQVLRALVREDPPPAVRGAQHLRRLVPELAPDGDAAQGPATDPAGEEARFALFDATCDLLGAAGAVRPLVVVLDDLHAADEGSLLLLAFVARHLRGTAVLVVGTYRDRDADTSEATGRLLAELGRAGRRLPLRGLDDAGVAALLDTRGGEAAGALARPVHRITGGNPFFVDELARLLAAEGRLTDPRALAPGEVPLPDSVRDVLTKRLAPLEAATLELLRAAAVIGRTFSVRVLEELAAGEDGRSEVLDRLGVAARAGLVEEAPHAAGHYAFTHALVRETLYRGLSAARRMALHRDVGEALERVPSADEDEHVSALAHHFLEAVPVGDPATAIAYAIRAGERAARQLAHEEAQRHFARALRTADSATTDTRTRCALLLALAETQRRTGDLDGARRHCTEAAELAREAGDAPALARAALGHAGALGGPGMTARSDDEVVRRLEEALDALDAGPDAAPASLVAQVQARLALELYYTPAVDRRRALAVEAVQRADGAGDPRSRLIARYALHWCSLGPDRLEERERGAAELLALARASEDPEMRFSAHHFRFTLALERGDLTSVDAELDACGRLAAELQQPFFTWQAGLLRAARALLQGRFEEGERLALEAFEAGKGAHEETAANLLAAQLFQHRWGTGRLEELAGAIDLYAAERPWIPAWRCAAAFLRSETGELAAARHELDALAADGFAAVPRDGNWSLGLSLAGLAATVTGAHEHAAALLELLAPYADRQILLAAGDACIGPVGLAVGALEGAVGHHGDALATLTAAQALATRLDARPCLARLHLERARVLRAMDRRADAKGELARAVELGERLGMGRLLTQAAELGEGDVLPAAPAPDGSPRLLERHGEFWRLADGVLLRDSKGLSYLATLLEHPATVFHAIDLVDGERRPLDAERDPRHAERARVNVTRAIRTAIAKVAEHDAALGEHLDRSVRTGTFTCYKP